MGVIVKCITAVIVKLVYKPQCQCAENLHGQCREKINPVNVIGNARPNNVGNYRHYDEQQRRDNKIAGFQGALSNSKSKFSHYQLVSNCTLTRCKVECKIKLFSLALFQPFQSPFCILERLVLAVRFFLNIREPSFGFSFISLALGNFSQCYHRI